KLSYRGSTSVADMYQTLSSGSKLSPCSQYWLWIRCIALCLLKRLAASYLLKRLATSYLLRRRHSLVIASGPEVAFVTLAIPGVGTWFSFAKHGDPAPVCMEVAKSRRSDNTGVMSIYDFLCMPSLDKVTVREEPHGLDTSILGRVVDRTTSPAPTGDTRHNAEKKLLYYAPRMYLPMWPKKTEPSKDRANHVANRKASTGPEISTNAANKTRSNKKGSGAGSSGQAVGDEVKQTNGGTLDDDDQRDGSEFAILDVIYPLILLPDKEVELHAELSGGSHDADDGGNGSDANVDPYHEAQVGNTAGDVLKRDILLLRLGGDSWSKSWFAQKELYKDHKVCRTALDRFPTPAETHQLREFSSVELSDRMSVLQCQLITHGSMLNARCDHSLKNVDRLTKRCSQQTQIIKKKNADIKQQSEFIDRANEEVSRLTAQLGILKSKCQTAEQKLGSWDKKHRKYRNERDTLAMEKAKIEEELVGTKSQLEHRERFLKNGEFNRAFAGLLNMAISVGVERGLRMDRTDKEFRELSQRVDGFILDTKEKFDRAVVAFRA
ncbi:hypothetical protein Tco_1218932, partial [Tanacetum coccineum]